MDTSQIALVQESFAKVLPIKDQAAEIFYADLFETAPAVKPYFTHANMAEQGGKLMDTIHVVVIGLKHPEKIIPVAQDLAVKHVEYGVKEQDYASVGASLLRTLKAGLGDAFTPEVNEAWLAAYDLLSNVMIDAAYYSNKAEE